MSYVLAIDVGTSFTAAAVARFSEGASPAPECLPLGLRGTAVPSVLYYPEDGPVLVGEAAERRGLDTQGRVVREFKRRVGDAVPISVGELSLPPEDVFATMSRWVVDRATEREGAPPSEVILTHPAAWGSHRTSMVLAAMAAQGLENVRLVPEPEAAALHYASQVRVDTGSTIAVYDLGGGTFDTAVLRKSGSNRFQLVGRPQGIENLGGADFDAEVFRFVAEHTGDVLSRLNPADAGVCGALSRLRRECVEAKEALSSDSEASISVLLPGFQQQIRLVRSEFEALIEDSVRDTVEALEHSLAQLDLEPADLSAVLLIGGSSRIPLVAQLISEQLDRPIAVDADPKSSICLGAAVSAVLAHAETGARAAAAEVPAEVGGSAAGLTFGNGTHGAGRLASWSRKSTTAGGAGAGALTPAHGRGGAHAPKPTVRLTAIAAAAALVSVLTATTAQGPAGFSNLASVFVPQAGAAPEEVGASGSPGASATGSGTGAAAAGAPMAGIQARVNDGAPRSSGPGLDVEASPTSRPSWSAAAEDGSNAAGGLAPAGLAAGESAGPAAGGTGDGPTDATGTPPGASDPGTESPVPVSEPTTTEPSETADPDPTTPDPDPTTTPASETADPDPTTATPDPTTTTSPPTTDSPPPTTHSPTPTTDPLSGTAEATPSPSGTTGAVMTPTPAAGPIVTETGTVMTTESGGEG